MIYKYQGVDKTVGSARTGSMAKGTVLVVDDDPNIRDLYQSAFDTAGMAVLAAGSGEEAVKLALEHHPEVILMDIIMPGMNGHETVSKIRFDDWGETAKIIYLTNLSDAENVVHAVERQSDEYIVKANTNVQEVVNRARAVMYT